jgi:hypothetical protein
MTESTINGVRLDIIATTIGGTPILRQSGGGSGGDDYMEFEQLTPSARWVISHPGFTQIPTIQVTDSQGNRAIPGVESSTVSQTILTFNPAIAGVAILG